MNSGRLSVPCVHDGSPLSTPDALEGGPARSRPGAPCPDAPLDEGFLLERLGSRFTLLAIGADVPEQIDEGGVAAIRLALDAASDPTGAVRERYLGEAPSAVYLVRPDQHVAARWPAFDEAAVRAAIRRATGKE